MTLPDADRFAREWCAAWNAHDVEAVLAHFHDDVVFTHHAACVVPESGGVVRGKDAPSGSTGSTRWQQCPSCTSRVVATYIGTQAVVINYRNQRQLVNEVLIFDGDLVREGHGTYLD